MPKMVKAYHHDRIKFLVSKGFKEHEATRMVLRNRRERDGAKTKQTKLDGDVEFQGSYGSADNEDELGDEN